MFVQSVIPFPYSASYDRKATVEDVSCDARSARMNGFRRILCAACGEEREEKLPVYVAEQFPHIRVECCDTCKHYLRTVDLTKNGNALPEADDLAAIPLTLWAQE